MSRPDRRRFAPPARPAAAQGPVAEPLRRRLYLAALSAGSAVLVLVWLLTWQRGPYDPYVLYVHPLLLLMCVWAAAWLWQGRSLVVAERVVFICNVLAVGAQMGLALIAPEADALGLASAAYWMLVALSILSYLLLSARGALWVSLALYALCVVLPWAGLALRGRGPGDLPELVRVQLTCGAILVLLYGLAWYRERFLLERGERLTLEALANTDALTGLPNRRALYGAVEGVLRDAAQDHPACLILLDLDHFKGINDRYGHNAGDAVLIQAAQRLRGHLRSTDTVGRWGGEEYLIVLPGADAAGATQVAERLRREIGSLPFAEVGPVTASLGVAEAQPGDDLDRWVARADAALYRAKAGGRNRVCVGGPPPAGVVGA
ncbi:GGDEF domain-containing protein [Deinococcus murrayi]|uniref:GGDEF domain-containing protein n=1 Tax=Deinococcus murrayi TaxID=68910 RepID=UPI000686EC3F|nr:GGDEF domain-containing protein [Deinococcus murrayi]